MASVSLWANKTITLKDAEAFAASVEVTGSGRRIVAETLAAFPVACQVRGMFFDGLVDVVVAQKGKPAAMALQEKAQVASSRVAFSLYPHRDFYKLFFLASPLLYPGAPLEEGLRRIAETFYPVFRDSFVGKTMSPFMGKDPAVMVKRLSEAYKLSIPWNEHTVVDETARSLTWTCKVEPCPLYPAIFTGIVQGTMKSHGVAEPRVSTLSSLFKDGALHAKFRVGW